MSKYVEDYLISLGFDLDSDEGKKYLDIVNKINSQNQESAKSTNKQTDSVKQQISAFKDFQNTTRQLSKTWSSFSGGNIFGAFVSGMQSFNAIKSMINGFQNPFADLFKNTGTDKAKSDMGDFAKTMDGFDRSKDVNATTKALQGMGKEFSDSNRSAMAFRSTIVATFGGGETAEGAGAAAGAAGGISAGAVAVGEAVGLAAAVVAVSVACFKMADGLAQANTQIESMAAKFWITNSAAWQLNNTLGAMGKSTADLNDIALNPVLRNQFKDLQQYQKQFLQLPKDFKNVNEQWSQSVTLPMEKMKLTGEYIKEMTSYNLQKALVGPMTDLFNILVPLEQAWAKMAEEIGDVINKISSLYKNSLAAKLLELGGMAMNGGGKTTSQSKQKASSPQSQLNDYNFQWASNMPQASTYAPQSSTTSNANDNSVNINSSPSINVYAPSSNPQSIGQAAASGVKTATDEMALIKSMQGVAR